MGSDGCEAGAGESGRISIHAPRMGSDDCPLDAILISMRFQSTLPGWGATLRRCNPLCRARDFNPRSPDGERPSRLGEHHRHAFISIHAPRMGSDDMLQAAGQWMQEFQSTLPGWGATGDQETIGRLREISIHAPRMGSDLERADGRVPERISIHAPRMGSDAVANLTGRMPCLFQSTLPGWGATAKMDIFAHDMGKIIHFQH